MAGYFSYFPKVLYTLEDDNTNNQLVVNIFARSVFLKEVADNAAVQYEYIIEDGETPEIIADKLYGDVNRNWIVLLFNRITNPYYEWPLVEEALHAMIETKYGMTIYEAQDTLHHYELSVTRSTLYNGQLISSNTDKYTVDEYITDYDTGKLTQRPSLPAVGNTLEIENLSIDMGEGTTRTEVTELTAVSLYDYELNLNNEKRKIKLLDTSYVHRVEEEFRKLMNG